VLFFAVRLALRENWKENAREILLLDQFQFQFKWMMLMDDWTCQKKKKDD
jgi:hypothetical protein